MHDKQTTDNTSSAWFWNALFKGWPIYGESIVATLLLNLFTLAIPLFVMNVYDRVVPNSAIETLWVLAIGASIVIGFDFVLRTLRGYFLDIAGKRADLEMSSSLLKQLLGTRLEARIGSTGSLASNLRDFDGLRDFFTSATLATLIDIPFLFVFLVAIWMIGGPVVIVPLLAVPAVLLTSILIEIPLNKAVQDSFRESTQKHAILVEALAASETIKCQCAEPSILARWTALVSKVAKSGLRSKLWSSLAVNLTTLIHQFTSIATVVYGVHLIKDGELTVGALIASTILSGRALAPLTSVASLLIRYRQSMTALHALNKLMAQPLDHIDGENYLQRPPAQGAIEFREVTFSYPRQEAPALRDITLKIAPGEHVAIIGRIGSGKSTLQRLILNLYQPQQGTVLLDGIDIRQISPQQLRSQTGYVSQDIVLFRSSLRENIAFSTPTAHDEDILAAAQLAGVDDFARLHPMGYDMPIGERGEGLSGGQRQAVALARALLNAPQILLLDEPTGSMDTRAEMAWLQRFTPFSEGRTLILVTHRASLLPLVQRVIVLEQGRIVADGPRDEVLQRINRTGNP